nr:MAG TPA: hypothetical protein [Caudoviricetes sp.]
MCSDVAFYITYTSFYTIVYLSRYLRIFYCCYSRSRTQL